MKLIQENPYRIAGILANASVKELVKQKNKISKFAEIGKQVGSELDFPFMDTVDRTNLNKVNKAFAEIEQNQDKVRHSLFWFLKANAFDETAINYLINGDKEKAVEIWEKVTNGKEVTSKNYSCFNNLGTVKLFSDSKEGIKAGIEAKIKMIESPVFEDFVLTVADQTYTIDNQKQAEKFVDDILKQFKRKYSIADTIKLFINCNGSIQKYLTQKFTEEPIHNIESQIASTKNKRKTNKIRAYELGLKLLLNCKDDLATLQFLLGKSDLKYKMIADNLAKEIMQCGIDYFKELQEIKDPSKEGIQLLKYAKSIAVGSQTKERIDSNIDGIEEFKEKDITQAIILLKSVKEAYENAYIENVKKAKKQVGINKEAEFIWRHGVRMQRIQPIHNPYEKRTIDYAAVKDAAKDAAKESINWEKVIELIEDVIPINSIEKIKNTRNTEKINEYKLLVNFIQGKINYTYASKITYLNYWKVSRKPTSRPTSPSSSTTSTSSGVSSGCYIATMAYGNYDHPQVLELRTFRDEFLSKSYLGRNFIKLYYKYSPLLVEKLKDKPKTNDIIRTLLDQLIKIIRK